MRASARSLKRIVKKKAIILFINVAAEIMVSARSIASMIKPCFPLQLSLVMPLSSMASLNRLLLGYNTPLKV